MSNRTIALAAVLLACGIGTASAQGQTQRQTQGQMPGQAQGSGQAQTAPPGQRAGGQATPPYREQVPDAVPLGSQHIAKPEINPSASGTLKEGDGRSPKAGTDDVNREHSGSVGANANTHPLESLKARGKPREEGITAPPAIQPTPHSTMNRDAGR
jgi:hypothetical protein